MCILFMVSSFFKWNQPCSLILCLHTYFIIFQLAMWIYVHLIHKTHILCEYIGHGINCFRCIVCVCVLSFFLDLAFSFQLNSIHQKDWLRYIYGETKTYLLKKTRTTNKMSQYKRGYEHKNNINMKCHCVK